MRKAATARQTSQRPKGNSTTGPSILQVLLDKDFNDETTDKLNQIKFPKQHAKRWEGGWLILEDKCFLMLAQATILTLDPYGPGETCVPAVKQLVPVWDIRNSRPKIGCFLDNLAQILLTPMDIV